MKIIPKTKEEWNSLVKTAVTGGAFIADVVCTLGAAQFFTGIAFRKRAEKTLREMRRLPDKIKEEIQKRVSEDYLKSDDFLVFISNALEEAMKLKNIEKLKHFRSMIYSGMVRKDLSEGKKLLFVDALSNLSIDSIVLLENIIKMSRKQGNIRITIQQIKQKYKYNDAGYLMASSRCLERYNLVEIRVPEIKMQNYSNYVIVFGGFGRDFLSFIIDYSG